jgi:hypothetical protein
MSLASHLSSLEHASGSLGDSDFCFWHDPQHTQEAAEARRLGGLRRRRESTVLSAYEFGGIDSIIERYLEVGLLDLVSLENSVARSRAFFAGVMTAAKLMEVGDLEERMSVLEVAQGLDHRPKGRR